jgi:hypothetical protein
MPEQAAYLPGAPRLESSGAGCLEHMTLVSSRALPATKPIFFLQKQPKITCQATKASKPPQINNIQDEKTPAQSASIK